MEAPKDYYQFWAIPTIAKARKQLQNGVSLEEVKGFLDESGFPVAIEDNKLRFLNQISAIFTHWWCGWRVFQSKGKTLEEVATQILDHEEDFYRGVDYWNGNPYKIKMTIGPVYLDKRGCFDYGGKHKKKYTRRCEPLKLSYLS